MRPAGLPVEVIGCALSSICGLAEVALAFCDADDDTSARAVMPLLTTQEASRADRFSHAGARHAHLRGRLAAKAALARLCGVEAAAEFVIRNDVFGRPLVTSPHAELGVSISHIADAAVALAFGPAQSLGVDLAFLDPGELDAVRTQVDAAEEDAVRRLGRTSCQAATGVWAAKEATIKALGGGPGVGFGGLRLSKASRVGDIVRLRFGEVPHLEVELLTSLEMVIGIAMPHDVRLDWRRAAPRLARLRQAGGARPSSPSSCGASRRCMTGAERRRET